MKKIVSTKKLSRQEWLMFRKKGIGGSDAGAICGLNPYVSPIHVYADKTSNEISEYDNEAMRLGRDLEEYVAKRFMEATGFKVRRNCMLLSHDKYPFMYANVDRMVVGEEIGLECKTASVYNSDKWEDGEVPEHYLIQCHHYMAVTGAKAWYIAVLILGKEFKYAKIERDEEIIENLIKIERDFWENHVLKKVMPNPDGSKAADEIIDKYYRKATKGKAIELQGFEDRLNRRDDIIQLMSKLEEEKKQIEQEIKLFMQDAELGFSATHKISWSRVLSSRIDTERLKKDDPDAYSKFIKPVSSRRLLIKAA